MESRYCRFMKVLERLCIANNQLRDTQKRFEQAMKELEEIRDEYVMQVVIPGCIRNMKSND